jgi:hypothetical protein
MHGKVDPCPAGGTPRDAGLGFRTPAGDRSPPHTSLGSRPRISRVRNVCRQDSWPAGGRKESGKMSP